MHATIHCKAGCHERGQLLQCISDARLDKEELFTSPNAPLPSRQGEPSRLVMNSISLGLIS